MGIEKLESVFLPNSKYLAPHSFLCDLSSPSMECHPWRGGPCLTCLHATDKNKYYTADNWHVSTGEYDGWGFTPHLIGKTPCSLQILPPFLFICCTLTASHIFGLVLQLVVSPKPVAFHLLISILHKLLLVTDDESNPLAHMMADATGSLRRTIKILQRRATRAEENGDSEEPSEPRSIVWTLWIFTWRCSCTANPCMRQSMVAHVVMQNQNDGENNQVRVRSCMLYFFSWRCWCESGVCALELGWWCCRVPLQGAAAEQFSALEFGNLHCQGAAARYRFKVFCFVGSLQAWFLLSSHYCNNVWKKWNYRSGCTCCLAPSHIHCSMCFLATWRFVWRHE